MHADFGVLPREPAPLTYGCPVIRRVLVTALNCLLLTAGLSLAPAEAAMPSKSQWLADVNTKMSGSQAYVDDRVARAGGGKLAINFDIDNTTLATHYAYGAPVRRVLRFANHAKAKGVTLLWNTGRLTGDGRMVRAKRQLQRAGYTVTEVCGRRRGESLRHSKQRCRRHYVVEGYTLIANVGNRRTDFTGGGYERAFRLPNYGNQLG
jgi:hypothetical protein